MDNVPEHSVEMPDEEDPGWPVGFMVMTGLAALYLVVRFVQLGVRFFQWVW
jgi:hypothetical protein